MTPRDVIKAQLERQGVNTSNLDAIIAALASDHRMLTLFMADCISEREMKRYNAASAENCGEGRR
jgi:hypothetical protein